MKFLQHHMAHSTMQGSYGIVEEQQEEEEQIGVELNMAGDGSGFLLAPSSLTPSVSSAASTTSAAPRAKKKTPARAETAMGGRSGSVSEQKNCKRGPWS
ncbi:hypothetical protein PoB_004152500 [Plakobranchus ocellatus]|uniref:Uncharacterized protein n=1 Tax=Plakobranchus ocellatus TaxID=259542 RepID=A0AAV4B5X9_9GAST|nr:hypothetical protein PoB_004152500 [Plakobranchus ocellatus]